MLLQRVALVTVISLLVGTATAGAVNINTADAPTIAHHLDGVSLPLAQRIVAHRQRVGRFRAVEDLGSVPYVGPDVLRDNRTSIRLD